MSMQALNLGLSRQSLLSNVKGKELLYHLRLVGKGNHRDVKDLEFTEIMDTDDCKVYYKGKLVTTTSTNELSRLISLATFKTMKLVEVQTPDGMYYAAIHEALLEREYVGVLTDTKGRVDCLVQCINNTLWADNGHRLIQLEDKAPTNPVYYNSQDAIRFINKNLEQFKGTSDDVVLFG